MASLTLQGSEGESDLKRWFEKIEQVFEICKCAEDDKVKFAMCTFEGRALTWWNGNVQTLGLANANQIPWSNVKAMMTTEYCPATEIEKDGARALDSDSERRLKSSLRAIASMNLILMCLRPCMRAINKARALVEQIIQEKAAELVITFMQNVTSSGVVRKDTTMTSVQKPRNQQNDGARARAYVVVENPQQNPKVVTDLLPTQLGSFDVIIGMDWFGILPSSHSIVMRRLSRIPLPNGESEVQGERPEKDRSLACIKADEKKLDDIRIVRDFPEAHHHLLDLHTVFIPSEMFRIVDQLKELQEKVYSTNITHHGEHLQKKSTEVHLKTIQTYSRRRLCNANFQSANFWLKKFSFLGHEVKPRRIHWMPSKKGLDPSWSLKQNLENQKTIQLIVWMAKLGGWMQFQLQVKKDVSSGR
ncbi:hypothetical protein Tco_0554812 [Tanacetum coccineum]